MTLAKAREAGAPVVSRGGVPAGKTVVVKDPDGFYVELVEADNAADSKATGNVIGSSMMISVNDLEQTVHLYRDLIGIPLKVDAAFAKNKGLSKTLGVDGARYRYAVGNIPGTMFRVDFVEFKGIDRKMGHTQPYDLGSSNLRARDGREFVRKESTGSGREGGQHGRRADIAQQQRNDLHPERHQQFLFSDHVRSAPACDAAVELAGFDIPYRKLL